MNSSAPVSKTISSSLSAVDFDCATAEYTLEKYTDYSDLSSDLGCSTEVEVDEDLVAMMFACAVCR